MAPEAKQYQVQQSLYHVGPLSVHRALRADGQPVVLERIERAAWSGAAEKHLRRLAEHFSLTSVVLDVRHAPEHVEIISAWPTGRTLSADTLANSAGDVEIRGLWVRALVRQIERLHGMGMVHGALQPASVVLVDGDVVLLGPGTVALHSAVPRVAVADVGALGEWAAPEYARTGPTEATDRYALGRLAGMLLPGRRSPALRRWLDALTDSRPEPRIATEAMPPLTSPASMRWTRGGYVALALSVQILLIALLLRVLDDPEPPGEGQGPSRGSEQNASNEPPDDADPSPESTAPADPVAVVPLHVSEPGNPRTVPTRELLLASYARHWDELTQGAPELKRQLEALLEGKTRASQRSRTAVEQQPTQDEGQEPAVEELHPALAPLAATPEPVLTSRPVEQLSGDVLENIRWRIRNAPSGRRDPQARVKVLESLAAHRDPRVTDMLLEWRNDSQPAVRRALAQMLAAQDTQAAAEALATWVERDDAGVRFALRDALAQLRDRAAIKWLIEQGLQADTPAVRAAVAKALGRIGARAAVPALTAALKDESADVRAAAATALGRLRHRESAGALRLLLDDTEPAAQRAALLAIASLPGASVADDALARLQADDGRVREAAIQALTARREPRAVAPLVERLAEETSRLRDDCMRALMFITGKPLEHLSQWQAWLRRQTDVTVPPLEAALQAWQQRHGEVSFGGVPLYSRRICIVLDVAHTVGGPSWPELHRKLVGFIDNLSPAHRFNLIRCGADAQPWMSRLVPCTDLNRRRALQYLNRLSDTGRGLAGALEAALADPTTDTILVIADAPPTTGLQGDALTAIAQATHRNAGRARIHVFALGDFDVSELAVLTRENDGELRRGIK